MVSDLGTPYVDKDSARAMNPNIHGLKDNYELSTNHIATFGKNFLSHGLSKQLYINPNSWLWVYGRDEKLQMNNTQL